MTKEEGGKRVVVSAKNIVKDFVLPHETHTGLKQVIIQGLRGKLNRGYERQHVLKGISIEIEEGDFFGIVGRNGSGKSTLLKILSGIYKPDSGYLKVDGSLVPFIELGVGFNPELTGRENVALNGALLGFNQKQVEQMYDDIVEFAELEKFMDQKLKNYSSGMQVRLAFSIAIRAQSDILVLDEVLAVGDEAFQRKCLSYFAKLKKEKKTVILVTHSMESVQQFCNKAILIEKGKVVVAGNPANVARHYSELFLVKNKDSENETIAQNDLFDVSADVRKTEKKINLSISITAKQDFIDPALGLFIGRDNGEVVWRWASSDQTEVNKGLDITIQKDKTLLLNVSLDNILPDGTFTLTVLVRKKDKSEEYARYSEIVRFDNYANSIYGKFWKMNEEVNVKYGR